MAVAELLGNQAVYRGGSKFQSCGDFRAMN